ncbi:MAG TPA: D-alanyl-lipoteichoic acid biosynthesis protein DltD [Candidatus Nanoarchaeia archaeon]|nr:D-alanyl-lipoteichoic acid biosynthesis protein DltD [Candidatus Nanoarchaeia archaeon]
MKKDRWGIILLLPAAIALAFMIYVAIISLYIDPYLSDYSDLGRSSEIFLFYQSAPDCPKVYYWGSSSIKEDLDLSGQSCQFNLGNPASTPLRGIAELDAMINSGPQIVVITVGPMSFSNAWLFPDDQYALISPYVKQIPSMYNKTVASLLKMDHLDLLLYKRKFLIPAAKTTLDSLKHKLTGSAPPYYYRTYNRDFISESLSKQIPESHAPAFEKKLAEKKSFTEYNVPIGQNSEKTSFEFIIHKLQQKNISVIIVKIPLNPKLVEKIPAEYLQNYDIYLEKVAEAYPVRVLDYTHTYNPSLFYDGHHLNLEGRKLFSQNLTTEVS